ncbi:hypothetical protein ABW20_dc0110052 [Dactylellina cionopaga]|nr:hypothetical protein ABW20_dc0110052 [Dactylellina cionopaga]
MGSQILKSKAPSALAKPLAPNYHALVTPVLHRRFVRASWMTLTIAYIGNILMENISGWPWSAFPLGRAGINTMVLFFFLLPILVLRIAQLSTTSNRSLSDLHCLLRSIANRTLFKCIFWYTLSAWLIVQFYLWNTLPASDLSIVTKKISYEPYQLNERPLYLLFYTFPLGIIQGFVHVWIDRDYLKLQDEDKTLWQTFSDSAVKSIQRIGTTIIASVVSAPICYWLFRSLICRVTYTIVGSFIKIHFTAPPQTLSNKIDLLFRSVWLTMLLVIAWEATNLSFTLEFGKGPIREGKTISEISPDPNGSLVLGLKLKTKPLSRRMAFKELLFIATEATPRRESIFKELTKPVCTLKQIMTECREAIKVIVPSLAPAIEPPSSVLPVKDPSPIKNIPGFSPKKPLEENVLRTPMAKTFVDQWQAAPGNTPTSPINFDSIKTHLIKKEIIESRVYSFLNPILYSQYGDIFRFTIQRKTTSLLPDANMQVDAINALTSFICASLKEDIYGMVQKDLPEILEELTKISTVLEGYISDPPLHWTDIHAKQVLDEQSLSSREALFPEAIELQTTINDALRSIGDAFGPYFKQMDLSVDAKRRIRLACETAKNKVN